MWFSRKKKFHFKCITFYLFLNPYILEKFAYNMEQSLDSNKWRKELSKFTLNYEFWSSEMFLNDFEKKKLTFP